LGDVDNAEAVGIRLLCNERSLRRLLQEATSEDNKSADLFAEALDPWLTYWFRYIFEKYDLANCLFAWQSIDCLGCYIDVVDQYRS
jgi:hypothetical protein